MPTNLLTEMQAVAGANPAAYISVDLIEAVTVARMVSDIGFLTGREIPVGKKVLSAVLRNVSYTNPPGQNCHFTKANNAAANEVNLDFGSDITATLDVFIEGSPASRISTVTALIQAITIRCAYASNVLALDGVDSSIATSIARTPNADAILSAANIDPLEAARVEGVIAYNSIAAALGASLGQQKQFVLDTAFPSFDFGTAATLVPLQQGRYLGIVPSSFQRRETARCGCADGPDIGVGPSDSTGVTIPPNPTVGTPAGSVVIGGPIPEQLDPLRDLGSRHPGTGAAGVYLPRAAYDGLTLQAMPSITVHAGDDGFIGFNAWGTVGFPRMSAALDAQAGGIVVTVEMDVSVSAICTLDLGCGVRLPIGYAIIHQAPGSHASLTVGFYPAVDQSGNVKLRAVLQNVDMGSYVAVVAGVGSALEIIGVTAWVGFLIDVVLSAIVSAELPAALRDAVRKYLGENEWILMRLGDRLRETYGNRRYTAPFEVGNQCLLASIGIEEV